MSKTIFQDCLQSSFIITMNVVKFAEKNYTISRYNLNVAKNAKSCRISLTKYAYSQAFHKFFSHSLSIVTVTKLQI